MQQKWAREIVGDKGNGGERGIGGWLIIIRMNQSNINND